jgi:formylglycine-generating enzyme required for sulfatase activity
MRRAVVVLGAAVAPACLLACSLTLSFDGIDDGAGDATRDEGGADTAAAVDQASNDAGDAAATDAAQNGGDASDATLSIDAGSGGDGAVDSGAGVADGEPLADASDGGSPDAPNDAPPEGGCPVGAPGPAMVSVGGFCIDSTEVTVAQYTDFLTAKSGDTSGQPPKCLWNSTYTPNFWPPSGPPDQAIRGVNWCDAYMFCAWAGKRLCGNPDGGSADPTDWANATKSQWFRACSRDNDGLHVYPYGLQYDPSACNGQDYDAGGPLPSLHTCQGGYPGLYDMSGNVIEWEDSCNPADPDASDQSGANESCMIRGGGFGQNAAGLRCDIGISTARSNGGGDNGFRCCSK